MSSTATAMHSASPAIGVSASPVPRVLQDLVHGAYLLELDIAGPLAIPDLGVDHVAPAPVGGSAAQGGSGGRGRPAERRLLVVGAVPWGMLGKGELERKEKKNILNYGKKRPERTTQPPVSPKEKQIPLIK